LIIYLKVSGGVTGAAAGTLTFMVGGKEEHINLGREILECMGKNIVHCGEVGTGGKAQHCTLCSNLLISHFI
jgi:3-hydroxyisobutyrate dehydrogenase